jgi:hypothetical protein
MNLHNSSFSNAFSTIFFSFFFLPASSLFGSEPDLIASAALKKASLSHEAACA